jgi:hypothetical protein
MSRTTEYDPMPDLRAGACRTPANAAVFHGPDANLPRAIEICNDCPVMAACREWGVQYADEEIWGGLTAAGLRAERRRRGIHIKTLRLGELADRAKGQRGVRS